MSGKLILLPKKSYTPWKAENIERVLRDERINENKNQLEAEEKRRKERINRIRRMKKISRNPIQNSNINILRKTKKEPTLSVEVPCNSDNMLTLLNNRYITKECLSPCLISNNHILATEKNKDKNKKPYFMHDINNKMTKYDLQKPYINDIHSTILSTSYKKNETYDRVDGILQREDFLTKPLTKHTHENIDSEKNLRKKSWKQQFLANVDKITKTNFEKMRKRQAKRERVESIRQRDLLLHYNIYPIRIRQK